MAYRQIPLSSLVVNPANDRHGELENETAAIAQLFAAQETHMRSLARDLVTKGEVFEPPLVFPDGDKFVVADGNRRTTCLKLLAAPRRAPTVELQKYFSDLRREWVGEFPDPGMEHRDHMCIINAALAGELFLKAIIAQEHPLLIFRDLFELDDPSNQDLEIAHIIDKGRTYNFEHLPRLLWVATGERLPDIQSFEKLRKARNAIQHFCSPPRGALRSIALEFLYKNIDPLIKKHFDLFAIEHHEDHIGYDYVVRCLIGHELIFSVPKDFRVPEIDLKEELSESSPQYRKRLMKCFSDVGFKMTL